MCVSIWLLVLNASWRRFTSPVRPTIQSESEGSSGCTYCLNMLETSWKIRGAPGLPNPVGSIPVVCESVQVWSLEHKCASHLSSNTITTHKHFLVQASKAYVAMSCYVSGFNQRTSAHGPTRQSQSELPYGVPLLVHSSRATTS